MQKRLSPIMLAFVAAVGFACSSSSTERPGGHGGEGGDGGDTASGGHGGSTTSGGKGGSSSGGSGGAVGGAGGSSTSGGAGGSSSGGSGGSGGTAGMGGSSTDAAASGGTGGSSSSPDAGRTDGGSGSSDGGPSGGSPAAVLDKFVFDVPCPQGTVQSAGNCTIPDANARKKTKTITFGGDPATTYKVKLHICAPMEGRSYTGCATGPESKIVCMDGTPMTGQYQVTYPTYSMTVSAPMHKYYLNNAYKADDIAKIEYSSTFEIKGGATITFDTDGGTNSDVYTADYNKHNLQCPGAPGIMQPFAGQFIYTTVESIDPMN